MESGDVDSYLRVLRRDGTMIAYDDDLPNFKPFQRETKRAKWQPR